MSNLIRLKPAGSANDHKSLFDLIDSRPDASSLSLVRDASDRLVVQGPTGRVLGVFPRNHPVARRHREGEYIISSYAVNVNSGFPARTYLSILIEQNAPEGVVNGAA